MADRNEIKDVVEALYHIKVAILSLIPDPLETIGQYRKRQKITLTIAIGSAVVSALALIVSILALLLK